MAGSVAKDMAKTRSADGRKLRPLGGAWQGVCLNQEMYSESGSHCHQNWLGGKRLFNCVGGHLGMGSKIGSWFCGR